MTSFLSLTGIAKTFDTGVKALGPVDLNVQSHEFLSLVGPSGCGKSTALRVIAGLLEPTEGTVSFASGKPETAFVFQEATMMPWANALDNARLPLDLKGLARRGECACGSGVGKSRTWWFREIIPARAFRRHENARLHRTRDRGRTEAASDGRALRRAR
jgi:ABC-type nitrate/sulfonate/bicarbonate transport system ATPase subunit